MVTSSAVVGSSAMSTVRIAGQGHRDHHPLLHPPAQSRKDRNRLSLSGSGIRTRRSIISDRVLASASSGPRYLLSRGIFAEVLSNRERGGTFDASGDTVMIDGQSATVVAQTANQINVSLKGITSGNHTVAVTTTFGATTPAAFSVTAPSAQTSIPTAVAPVLNSAQGYNDATNTYETTANTISAT